MLQKLWNLAFGNRKALQTSQVCLAEKHPQAPEHTKFVFTDGKKRYYQFSPDLNIPSKRYFEALDIISEMNLRCTSEFTDAVLEQIAVANAQGKSDQVAFLVGQHQLRRKWLCLPELLYKFAAVVYIAEDEDPYGYNEESAKQKIENWKAQSETYLPFFLQQPIGDLLPQSNLSEQDLNIYFEAVQKMATAQSEIIASKWTQSEKADTKIN